MTPFKTAYQLAREKFRQMDRRVERVQLAKAKPVKEAVSLRAAGDVPYTPRPISIFKPTPDDPVTIKQFVRDQFIEAQQKKKAIAR